MSKQIGNTMNEQWKDIKGYEGLYRVSNLGRVKGLNRVDSIGRKVIGGIMRSSNDKDGYKLITLCKKAKRTTYKVHRLVAQAFIPNPNDLPQINHIDEDRTNNCIENLEWCTSQYNNNYGDRTKNSVAHNNYKTIARIESLNKMHDSHKTPIYGFYEDRVIWFDSVKTARRFMENITNHKVTNISNVLTGRHKVCFGWTFKYAYEVEKVVEI